MKRLMLLGLVAHAAMLLTPVVHTRGIEAAADLSVLVVVGSAIAAAAFEASATPWIPGRARRTEGARLRTWSAAASIVLGVATIHAACGAVLGPGLWIGTALLIVGGALRRAAIVELGGGFRTEGGATRLCTSGLYRYVRHPSELGLMLMSGGLVVIAPSYLACGLAIAQLALLVVRLQIEEAALRACLGDAYRDYARTTPPLLGFGPADAS